MTDRAKFEEMLERLIAEDREAAEELFHEIVVEKSREIYQSILESDEEVEEAEEEVEESEDDLDEAADEEVDESEDDLDESEDDDLDEMFGLDEFEVEAPEMGGDATDDMMGDIEMGGDEDEEGEEGDEDEEGEEEAEGPEEALSDLEDALEALKAEFEKMMGDEGEEEPEEESFEFESADEEVEESEDEDEDEESDEEEVEESRQAKTAAEQMREYVEKVAPAKMGDNGANAKSVVAGKNDMGGTTQNIVRGDTEAGVEANKGQLKGNGVMKGSPKEMNTKNVNVPGAKGATKMAAQPGHGAEKKGKPENAANKKSTIGGK